MAWWRQSGSWRWFLGLAAISGAAVLYLVSVLCSPDCEPLLVTALLLLLPVGVYLTSPATPFPAAMAARLAGPGRPETDKRKRWVEVQLLRGRAIRMVALTALVAALALFVQNHVEGSIGCRVLLCGADEEGTNAKDTSSPKASTSSSSGTRGSTTKISSGLRWATVADRWAKKDRSAKGAYQVRAGDALAKVAEAHRTTSADIARENPAARFAAASSQRNSPSQPALTLPAEEITLEGAALRNGMAHKPIDTRIAAAFGTAPLAEGQTLVVPAEPPYDPRQWVDWLLWALAGIAAYLLIEIARHMRSLANGEGDFLGETHWYWAQLATGPLVAFVILLLFTHVDVDLLTGEEAALEVNLRQYPVDLLIVPAFLLGFYSRVAREVLDQLMRAIFRSAWRAAYGEFEVVIKGQEGDREIASAAVFETRPATPVVWSATAGTISSDGVFTPPAVTTTPTDVHVTAMSTASGRAVTKTVKVVKLKFEVVTANQAPKVVTPAGSLDLSVVPLPPGEEDKIEWRILVPPPPVAGQPSPAPVLDKTSGPVVKLTVAQAVAPGTPIVVQATYAGLARTIELTVAAATPLQPTGSGAGAPGTAAVP